MDLDGEEITFIADEPVDFAYKGVDHMAGVWARYKSMTIPRRVVAVGRSRRGTVPSWISELREAMLSNLQTAGRPAARLWPSRLPRPFRREPAPWTTRLDAYSNVPEPIDTDPIDGGPLGIGFHPHRADLRARDREAPAELDNEEAAEFETASGPEPTFGGVDLEAGPVPDETGETDEVFTAAAEVEPISAPVTDVDVETPRAPLRPGPGLIRAA